MNFHYSRHAKRRMALYNINKFTVESILKGVTSKGKQEIVKKISKYKYPIKVVFEIKNDLIITVYPLKRALK